MLLLLTGVSKGTQTVETLNGTELKSCVVKESFRQKNLMKTEFYYLYFKGGIIGCYLNGSCAYAVAHYDRLQQIGPLWCVYDVKTF